MLSEALPQPPVEGRALRAQRHAAGAVPQLLQPGLGNGGEQRADVRVGRVLLREQERPQVVVERTEAGEGGPGRARCVERGQRGPYVLSSQES